MRIGKAQKMSNRAEQPTRAARAKGRRHPLASVALITIGLLGTGGAYALFTTTAAADSSTVHEAQVDEGKKLFDANCATCHGMSLEGTATGPTLILCGNPAPPMRGKTSR